MPSGLSLGRLLRRISSGVVRSEDFLRRWVDQHACPRTAAAIQDRSLLFRFLDIVLGFCRFRHVPPECAPDDLEIVPQFSLDPTKPNAWPIVFENAVKLVIHDDTLNWQKLHVNTGFHIGLLTAFGLSLKIQFLPLAIALAFAGLVFAWLFDRTMQEGMRCVRAHKERVRALERRLFSEANTEFMFRRNPFNQRDALELEPLILFACWTVLLLVSVGGWLHWFSISLGDPSITL